MTDLIGKKIKLTYMPPNRTKMWVSGAFRTCWKCNGQHSGIPTEGREAVIRAGTKEHPYRTECADCGRHLGWLRRAAKCKLEEARITK
jgi:hypothetical protein